MNKDKRSIRHMMKDSGVVFALLVTLYTVIIVLLPIISSYGMVIPFLEVTEGRSVVSSLAIPLAGIIFVLSNIIVEIYGKKKAIMTLGFAYLISIFGTVVIILAKITNMQTDANSKLGWNDIFIEFRFAIVGIISFMVAMGANSSIIWSMKKRFGDRYLTLRLLVSSLIGQAVDNITFVTLAFAPLGITSNEEWMDWPSMYVLSSFEYALEIGIEILLIPLSHIIIIRIKKAGLYEGLNGTIIKYDNLDSFTTTMKKRFKIKRKRDYKVYVD